MGYAGNAEPSYIIPSTIAVGGADSGATVRSRQGIDDLDFYIGNEVRAASEALPPTPTRGSEA
jgi:actin-related protein 3